jgi:Tol biopolymer transport system component/DNA-binding winged helix-turn-helix (wHTH) protein
VKISGFKKEFRELTDAKERYHSAEFEVRILFQQPILTFTSAYRSRYATRLCGHSTSCPEDRLKSGFIFSEGVLKMVMRKHVRYLYEFGPYRLDAAERILTCEGKAVSLPPKVFDTLLVLVENQGRVMEKEELLKILWPDSYVEESNLTTYVSQLRKALSESSEGQSYIETVPRRGYRFIAEVKKTHAEFENFLIHERTDTRILIEEEISEPEAEARTAPLTVRHEILVAPKAGALSLLPQLSPTQKKVGVALIACCSLAIIAVGMYLWNKRATLMQKPSTAFQRMTITKLTASGKVPFAAISPDGKYVAHVLQDTPNQSLWLRQTSTTSSMLIVPPAPVHYLNPTYSPDSIFIYYVTYEKNIGTLYQVPALGGTPRKLIEDVDSPVTFSPDGKSLAFFRHNPKTKETSLITADAEGQNQAVLLTRKYPANFSQDGSSFYAPSWSPDGQVIACAAIREESENGTRYFYVIAINVNDRSITPITSHKWHWVGQAAWLPDGRGLIANAWDQSTSTVSDQIWHIAYPSGNASRVTNDVNSYKGISIAAKTGTVATIHAAQVSRLWVMPNGKEVDSIPITSGFGETYSDFLGLDWALDGRIVYGSNASGNADIWIMDQDGQNQKQLTTNPDRDMTPVVAPDGRYIVYVNFQGRVPHVMRMEMDGSNPTQLTQGLGEITPTISPDGRWVVYTGFDGNQQAIFKVPMEGGVPVQITPANYVRAEYSPDGKWLACILYLPETAEKKIALLPAAGGDPVRIIEQIPYERWSYLRWLPDSRAFTLAGIINGVSNIYKYPLAGGEPQPVTNFKNDWIFRYAWSRDGKMLAVERGMPVNDVILISDLK